MTPQQYCREKALHSGSCLHYSLRFLPVVQRHALLALYAFFREIKEISYLSQHASDAKFHWWLGEIRHTFAGTPSHPVCQALVEPIARYQLQLHYFEEIIESMFRHMDVTRYSTFADLEQYCQSTSSVLSLLCTQVGGYQNENTLKYAEQLGIALQLTYFLRNIRKDIRRGYLYIPQEDLKEFQVPEIELLNIQSSELIQSLFAYQTVRIRAYYHEAFKCLPKEDQKKQQSSIVHAQLILATLKEIELDGYQLFSHSIHLPPLRKIWITGQTLWQIRKGQVEYYE